MRELIRQIATDDTVKAIVLLVGVDFILGVAAALKVGAFRLSYVADTLKADVLWKFIPYVTLLSATVYAGSVDLIVPGIDWNVVTDGAFGVIVLAFVGSILNSIRDLGLGAGVLPDAVAGPDPATPAPPANVDVTR